MADSSFPRFAPRARSTSLPSSNRQAPFTREAAGGSPVRTSLPSAGMRLEGGVCGQRCGHGPAARTESAQGTPAEPPPQPCRHCHSRSSSLTTPRPPPPYGPGRSLRELGEDVTGSGGENAHRGREPPAAAPARSGGSGHAKQVGTFPAPGRDLPSPAATTSPCFHSRDSAALRKPLSRARSRASMVPRSGPAARARLAGGRDPRAHRAARASPQPMCGQRPQGAAMTAARGTPGGRAGPAPPAA